MSAPTHVLALPPGYVLESYRIERVLGEGGFGITYLAVETHSQKRVAIKELLPRDIATRIAGSTVVPQGDHLKEAFQWAQDSFLSEARSLAQLSHPNIVPIHRLFPANGTGYMVMDFVQGQSLKEWFTTHPQPTEEELWGILLPLLDGLEHVHEHGLLHRDIKPDNIFITTKGRPMLLDFGSARVDTGRTQTMTAVVSEGYAPVEQYQRKARQSPATDLYALAAVMVRAITGEAPATAIDRTVDATLQQPVSQSHANRYSAAFLCSVDAAFAVKAEDRPQSAEQWRELLGRKGDAEKGLRSREAKRGEGMKGGLQSASAARHRERSWLPWLATALVSVGLGAAVFVLLSGGTSELPTSTKAASPSAPTPGAVVASAAALATTTKAAPFVNTLGMKFVPVPGTNVLFCIHETRSRDYAAFMANQIRGYSMSGGDAERWRTYEYQNVPVGRGAAERAEESDHPVSNVSWEDATAFCTWLSRKEGKTHRLPMDHEWSMAVGIGARESASESPENKSLKIDEVFPWGGDFPPTGLAGNYADSSAKAKFSSLTVIEGYRDGYATTAPVMSFDPDKLGLYDLGGNVWEWCQDLHSPSSRSRVLRGGSWAYDVRDLLASSYRNNNSPDYRSIDNGFRCVVVVGSSSP